MHRRQMADGVTRLGMRHQLWSGCGPGGEIQEQEVVGASGGSGSKLTGRMLAFAVRHPSACRAVDGNTDWRTGQAFESTRERYIRDYGFHLPAL